MLGARKGHEVRILIGAVPLPEWRDALAFLVGRGADDRSLAAPWRRGEEGAVWFSRGALALRAVAEWRRAAGERPPAVWFPGYFCNQSTAAVRAGGFETVFYAVDRDLRPRWDDCEALAARTPPGLFVLVHYFGHPTPAAAARSFCDGTGALLIEDAAHVALPGPGIGEHGDFVLYSPHKILAVPDGSVLLTRERSTADALRQALAGTDAPAAWPWLAKRLARKILPAAIGRRRPAFADDPPFVPLPETPCPSRPGRRLLARTLGRMEVLAALRRAHGQSLQRAWAPVPGCRPLFPLDGTWTPYRFPLLCENAPDRFDALLARGCWAEQWPDLAPEVAADPHRHDTALALRNSLLLLPVHPSANDRHLVSCCGPA